MAYGSNKSFNKNFYAPLVEFVYKENFTLSNKVSFLYFGHQIHTPMNLLQKLLQQINKEKAIDTALIILIAFMVVLYKMNRDNLY